MLSFKEYLLRERSLGTVEVEDATDEIFSSPLSASDISKLRQNNEKFFTIALTDRGTPYVFGATNPGYTLKRIEDEFEDHNFIAMFTGEILKKVVYLQKDSPYDWQYQITRTKLKQLKVEFDRAFPDWKLPI